MKRSFKNLFMIIAILAASFASNLNAMPVEALGGMTPIPAMPGLPIPEGGSSPLDRGHLSSMWGADGSRIFAVGYGHNGTGTLVKPVIYQTLNGTNWTSTSPALPYGFGWGTGYLEAVWGKDDTHVYAAGRGGVGSTASLPMISTWDGSSWVTSSPALPSDDWDSAQLFGIWGVTVSATTHLWAVGNGGGPEFTNMPLVYHGEFYEDGSNSWTSRGLPLPSGYKHAYLAGVWGISSTNIYAAGLGEDSENTNMPLLYHYDGTDWSSTTLTLPTTWDWGRLDDIWGSGADDIYAVGQGGTVSQNLPLIYHWDGVSWTGISPSLPTTHWTSGSLKGVWGYGTDVYIAGYGFDEQSGIGVTAPLLYRKTSSGWVASSYPPSGWAAGYFEGVWGYDADNVYAVGYGYLGTNETPLLDYAGLDDVAPGPVTNLTADEGTLAGSVTLTWTAPADDGPNPPDPNTGPVSSYVVQYSTNDDLTSCTDGTPASSSDLPVPVTPGAVQTMTVTGLTPGTLYYFSVCAYDEASPPNESSLATTSATASTSDAGIYDDTDLSRWTYSTGWKTSTTTTTGPYNNSIHYTTSTTPTATFTFQGPGYFDYYYAKYTNRGKFRIYVDGVFLATINAYAAKASWQNKYTSPIYTDNQVHTVMVKNMTSGKRFDVDAIEIHDPPAPAGPGIYDDKDIRWSYSTGWKTTTATGPYMGSYHYTVTKLATASFTFQGPAAFVFYYGKYTNRGKFHISVDGVFLTEINAYATTKSWQNAYISPPYTEDKAYTVTIENINAKEADVDAIKIYDPTPAGPDPIPYDDTDPRWIYSGVWKSSTTVTGPYNNSVHYTTQKNATASFTFQGPAATPTTFTFYYAKASNRGKFRIYVDGVLLATINAYSAKASWQNKYVSPIYDDGLPHTVKIINLSASRADIDAVLIE